MNSERLNRAFALAAELHQDQAKKGAGTPYLAHLLGVASIVIEYGGEEDEVIAALLHDAVEDQGGQRVLEKLEAEFGTNVARIVRSCSDSIGWLKPSWKKRKRNYLHHLEHETDASERLVSAADKLYNVRSIIADYHQVGAAVFNRFKAGKEGTSWYYRSLADIFLKRGPLPIAKELNRQVCQFEALMKLTD